MSKDPKVSEIFSTKQAAKILQRAPFCLWYHVTRNIKDPIWINGCLYLTKGQMRDLVENHLRLKPGESMDLMLLRVDKAKP